MRNRSKTTQALVKTAGIRWKKDPSVRLQHCENMTTKDVHFGISAAVRFVNYLIFIIIKPHSWNLKRNFKSYPITMNKIVYTSSAMLRFDVIKNVMSSNVPEKKKKDPQAEQSPRSQGHCDLSKGAKHPGSGPSPLQSRLGSMWLWVAPPYQRKVGWAENVPAFSSGPHKSYKFRVPDTFSIRLSIFFWILAQTTGTVCAKPRSTLMECKCST